jgi:hypothetical protein
MPTPYGHLRLLVASDACDGREYLVDLVSYKGNGRCNCTDFETRCWPLIRDNKAGRRRCKHIHRSRQFISELIKRPGDMLWLDVVIAEWIRRYGPNTEE